MQSKIATPSRLTARLHHWARRLGYPVAAFAVRWVPRPLHRPVAHLVIWLVMMIYPEPKRAIASNLERILGHPAASRTVRRATAAMIRNFGIYWCDLFYFGQANADHAMATVKDVRGWNHVEAAQADGRGAILMTGHLGNWEVGGMILGRESVPVSVVYVPDRFAETEAFRTRLRDGVDLEEIPLSPDDELGSLRILRALRQNRLVALQGDRDFNDCGTTLDFFGAPAPFPCGPFILSRLTGAPLLPFFITYTARYQLEIVVHEPITVAQTKDREGDLREAMERWVTLLENAISAAPTQWYTFYPFWAPRPSARRATEREPVTA